MRGAGLQTEASTAALGEPGRAKQRVGGACPALTHLTGRAGIEACAAVGGVALKVGANAAAV
jgi:hypothetical protein